MSNQSRAEAAERSPLLPNGREHVRPHASESSESACHGPTDDIESIERPDRCEDAELMRARKKIKSLLPFLGMGIFLAFLDQSIVAAINGDIGSELHSVRSVSWIATAYFLTMTASQPLYGKLSDVFGRKPCLLFAYAMFGLGSLGCGLTKNMNGLIAARALQGIGGGGMLIVVTVLLSDFIPLRERGTYQGYLNLIGAIGSTSGGPIGGLFVQSIGWRWAFLIQVFLCLIALVALSYLLDLPTQQSDTPWRKQLLRIDFGGALLLILTITALLFGLEQGSNLSWNSPVTVGSLAATLPLGLAFLLIETRFALEPFTPGHIIFDKSLFACYAQNFLGYAAFTSLIFHLPLYFQIKHEMTPAQAGAGLIPAAISVTTGTILGGIILKKTGKFYWLAVIAATASTIGCIPLVVAPSLSHGSLPSIYIGSILGFVPQGVAITASLIAIISNVSAADQAVATACSFLFRSLGAAVGVSLIGVIIQHVLQIRLRASIGPEEADHVLHGISQSLEFIKDLPPSLGAVVRNSYCEGIQAGFLACVILLALSTFSVLWWKEKKLSS